jgi:predicted peptidase
VERRRQRQMCIRDRSYPVSIYKALKACGGSITLTLFDDANHNSWTRVYDSPEIYEWLFKQTKKTNIN